ncbi:MAG: type II toxin-antitoxin system PemK/MazF family toxin [Candidatus Doudnabacteria bacterium]|nr:type II toxin-antitoxin system PemK/MazF family toxin [Candidatus Doudnabacteria bacterium]
MELNELINWYLNWTKIKIKIQHSNRLLYFKEREIWWTSIGANIGFEQNGKNDNYERPIIIFKKFNKDMVWALPLTSQNKTGKFYFDISNSGVNSRAILSQLRLISSKRLIRKMGILDIPTYKQLKKQLSKLLN